MDETTQKPDATGLEELEAAHALLNAEPPAEVVEAAKAVEPEAVIELIAAEPVEEVNEELEKALADFEAKVAELEKACPPELMEYKSKKKAKPGGEAQKSLPTAIPAYVDPAEILKNIMGDFQISLNGAFTKFDERITGIEGKIDGSLKGSAEVIKSLTTKLEAVRTEVIAIGDAPQPRKTETEEEINKGLNVPLFTDLEPFKAWTVNRQVGMSSEDRVSALRAVKRGDTAAIEKAPISVQKAMGYVYARGA